MDFTILLFAIIKIAVMLGIGMWIGHKVVPINPDIRKLLIFLIINVTLPSLIFSGFLQLEVDRQLLQQLLGIFAFSISFIMSGTLIGWLVAKAFRFSSQKAREAGFLSIFGNTGLIGIPLCAALFGPKGAVMAAVFDAGTCLTLWTVGVWMVQRERVKMSWKSLKSVFSAPTIAVLLGFLIILFEVDPGYLVKDIVGALGGAASPLSMFYIGMLIMMMFKAKKKVSLKLLSLPVAMKLFVFPLIALSILAALPFFSTEAKALIHIQFALPNIATAAIIMAMFGADEEYAAMGMLTTTLLSLITIPLQVTIAQWLLF